MIYINIVSLTLLVLFSHEQQLGLLTAFVSQANWIQTIGRFPTEKPYNTFVGAPPRVTSCDWSRDWTCAAADQCQKKTKKPLCCYIYHLHIWKNENSHLHPRSPGLQIYSLHHRCRGSSWSQKVHVYGVNVRGAQGGGRPGYRGAGAGQLLAPGRCAPVMSHNICHMPSVSRSLWPAQKHRTRIKMHTVVIIAYPFKSAWNTYGPGVN